MKKIDNWDNIEAKGMEDFKALPIGAYECIIKEAEVYKNQETGKESFRVAIDIAIGEFKDYLLDIDDIFYGVYFYFHDNERTVGIDPNYIKDFEVIGNIYENENNEEYIKHVI